MLIVFTFFKCTFLTLEKDIPQAVQVIMKVRSLDKYVDFYCIIVCLFSDQVEFLKKHKWDFECFEDYFLSDNSVHQEFTSVSNIGFAYLIWPGLWRAGLCFFVEKHLGIFLKCSRTRFVICVPAHVSQALVTYKEF